MDTAERKNKALIELCEAFGIVTDSAEVNIIENKTGLGGNSESDISLTISGLVRDDTEKPF